MRCAVRVVQRLKHARGMQVARSMQQMLEDDSREKQNEAVTNVPVTKMQIIASEWKTSTNDCGVGLTVVEDGDGLVYGGVRSERDCEPCERDGNGNIERPKKEEWGRPYIKRN